MSKSANSNLLVPKHATEFGPAMTALSSKHVAFVLAYATCGMDATKAARAAGYVDNNTGALKVTAYRIMLRPDIRAAIREVTISRAAAGLPVYFEALEKVAGDPQHKDQVKAIGMLMDRGGMPAVVERNVNVNITLSREEKEAEIRQMAETLGMDADKLLGSVTVTDAEFDEVPNGLEDVW